MIKAMIARIFTALALLVLAHGSAGACTEFQRDRFGCQKSDMQIHSDFRSVNIGLSGRVSLSGVVPELASKAREIVAACGARVMSGVARRTIAGTRRLSLHAFGRAVDLGGNPTCIYAHLRTWPGGVSTDYATVRPPHVHVSYQPQGREWGLRFAHARVSRRNIFRRYATRGRS